MLLFDVFDVFGVHALLHLFDVHDVVFGVIDFDDVLFMRSMFRMRRLMCVMS